MIRHYPKTFEDVFPGEKSQEFLKREQVSFDGIEEPFFMKSLEESIRKMGTDVFDYCVRFQWLRRKFRYFTRGRNRTGRSPGLVADRAFSLYCRTLLNKDVSSFSRSFLVQKINGYLDGLFPGFDEGDPFRDPEAYRFPFPSITVDYLMPVYQMEERVDLLKKADKEGMSYNDFLNFVTNYILSVNDSLGRVKYTLVVKWRRCPPYIKDNDRTI